MKHKNQNKSPKTLENLFLLALFLCGLCGALYFFSPDKGALPDDTLHDWEVTETTPLITDDPTHDDPPATQLHIEGVPEVDATLTFKLSGFRAGQRYLLDLGDGQSILLEDDTYRHAYGKAGAYRVRLEYLADGDRLLLYSELLKIEEDVEVAVSSLY